MDKMTKKKTLNQLKQKQSVGDIYAIPIDDFFKSAFSVDCVIFGYHGGQMNILLIQRGTEPYENFWALPGDLVYPNEDLDTAAIRVLNDLTSVQDVPVRQVHTFGKVNRHPLGRVITIAYLALVETTKINPLAAFWAKDSAWHPLSKLPKLAFDHREILEEGLMDLRSQTLTEAIWSKVLPKKFTLTEFQELFETILDKKFDKGNFRKKLTKMKFLIQLNESQQNVSHRPSLLYSIDQLKLEQMLKRGYVLNL